MLGSPALAVDYLAVYSVGLPLRSTASRLNSASIGDSDSIRWTGCFLRQGKCANEREGYRRDRLVLLRLDQGICGRPDMEEIKTRSYAWSKSWIEFTDPNAQGVYWPCNKDGKVLSVGKGKVRQREPHPRLT